MRVLRIGLALAVAMTAVGCDKETGPFLAPEVPLAYTRFVNAVPDTFHLDYRFIDQLEYSPSAILLQFRQFTPYQGTAPGTRPLRVFTNPGGDAPDIDIVANTIIDESVTLTAGTYYTIAVVGFTRTGSTPAVSLMVMEDPIPSDVANVAVRTVHFGSGMANLDVFGTADDADPLPGSPTFSNVGFGSSTAYTTQAPGALAFQVTTAGTTTVLAARDAPAGIAADPSEGHTTVGGVQQAGSVITAFVFPASSTGTAGASFTAPGIVYVVDRHPR
jgi:hypothetical protein